MEYSKNMVLLCLFEELINTNKLNPKDIVEKYKINNRQMWRYIKNLKEQFETFKNKTIEYNITDKMYYLKQP